jgi:antitoxin CcdA
MDSEEMKMADGTRALQMDADLLDEAETLGVDASRAAEAAVTDAVRMARAAEWKRENRAALEAWNEWTEKNGLPLAKYRQF